MANLFSIFTFLIIMHTAHTQLPAEHKKYLYVLFSVTFSGQVLPLLHNIILISGFLHVLNNIFLKACTAGLYGDMCQHQCGHCLNISKCEVYGTCLSGCQPGYTSEFCNECELVNWIICKIFTVNKMTYFNDLY